MARLDPAPTPLPIPIQAVPLALAPTQAPDPAFDSGGDSVGLGWEALQARVAACQACGLWRPAPRLSLAWAGAMPTSC